MKLYFSKTSPFARKVRMTAAALGLQKEIELLSTDVYGNTDSYKKINPLIKIPALETRTGEVLTNSPFICQYLASLKPGEGFFPLGDQLWTALNFQSVADGGMEAAVLRRYESQRTPDKFDSAYDLRQRDKILNALDFLQSQLFKLSSEKLTISEVSTICFVDYLRLRFAAEKFENRNLRLFDWTEKWNKHPAVNESSPL